MTKETVYRNFYGCLNEALDWMNSKEFAGDAVPFMEGCCAMADRMLKEIDLEEKEFREEIHKAISGGITSDQICFKTADQ